MLNRNPQTEKTGLEQAIDTVLREMKKFSSDTEEYKKMVDQLTKLYTLLKMEEELNLATAESVGRQRANDADCRLKDIEAAAQVKELDRKWKVSQDTLAIVAGNLLGIVVIVGYERAHVLVSKALPSILKTR